VIVRQSASGIVTPPMETIAAYHPYFALAALEGVPVRPNLRTVQAVFGAFNLNQPVEESFDQQITGLSLFTGASYSLDPITAFVGNLFQYVSAEAEQAVTGITCDILVQARGETNYAPIPTQTPLQLVPQVLGGAAGVWAMDLPDNVKVRFTLTAAPAGAPPLTVWLVFAFLVLGSCRERDTIMCMDRRKVREELARQGYGPMPRGGGGSVAPSAQ